MSYHQITPPIVGRHLPWKTLPLSRHLLFLGRGGTSAVRLEAAGIPTLATDENIGETLMVTAFGGIKLQVASKDADRAKESVASFKTDSQPKRPIKTLPKPTPKKVHRSGGAKSGFRAGGPSLPRMRGHAYVPE